MVGAREGQKSAGQKGRGLASDSQSHILMDMDGHEMPQKVYSFCGNRNASFIVLVGEGVGYFH